MPETKLPEVKSALTEAEKTLVEKGSVAVRKEICNAAKNYVANSIACGLAVVALVSFFFPDDWSSFSHALQAVCFAGALAVIFVVEFQKLSATLKTLRRGVRREVVLCVTGGLLLLVGTCALVLAAYSPDKGLAFALRVAGIVLFAFAIGAMLWAWVLQVWAMLKIVKIYRKTKATDDEAELKALAAEIDRINREF